MFNSIDEKLNQSNQAHAVNWLALAMALIEKGVITEDEINSTRIRATQIVEQEFAKKRDDALRELAEQHPGMSLLFRQLKSLD